MTQNKLDYDNGYDSGKIPKDKFKISPSQFATFFNSTNTWFREAFLGENDFDGNTSTYLGTCLHYLAEQYAGAGITDNDRKQIEQYLDNASDNQDVDKTIVESELPEIWEYLSEWITEHLITDTEEYILMPITDNVVLAGSLDYKRDNDITGGKIIGDYKSTSSSSAPRFISFPHKVQVYLYAYAEKNKGVNVDTVEITYILRKGKISEKTGNQLKPHTPEIHSLQLPFNDEAYQFIDNLVKLVAETMEHFFKNPEQAYLLFKDYRLKGRAFDVLKFNKLEENAQF